jgi:hypothetical protein
VAGFVYFIRSPLNDLVKIGYTAAHPDGRLRRLRATCPVHLEPLGHFAGTPADERELHERFDGLWSHGEWFRADPALMECVAQMAGPWVDPKVAFRRRPVVPKGEIRTQLDWAKETTVTHRGTTYTFAEWAERTGRSLTSIRSTITRNIPGGNRRVFGPGYYRQTGPSSYETDGTQSRLWDV